jgi:hypothetical protein
MRMVNKLTGPMMSKSMKDSSTEFNMGEVFSKKVPPDTTMMKLTSNIVQ